DILLPFVVGAVIAYFFDPVVARLQRVGLSRTWATATVTILAALIAVGGAMAVVPPLFGQVEALIARAPQYVVQAVQRVQPTIQPVRQRLGLSLVGLQFGFVIGLIAGLISFIPFVGTLVGATLALGMALAQFPPDWIGVVKVAVVFLIGHLLEGNILSPKLVGDRVGLHPVWIMFALLAGGSLFGFVGVLVAVPVAAVVGVIVR